MHPKSLATWVILAALFIFLIAAFVSILEMRFSPGDIYPHYSTKRSDPLGTRAFYESLEKLPAIEVSRNVVSLQRIKGLDDETTLILLGLSRSALRSLRVTDDSPMLKAVRNGARLVIIVNPEFVPTSLDEENKVDNWFERREKLKKNNDQKDGEDEDEDEDKSEDKDKDENEDKGDSAGENESDEQAGVKRGEPFLQHVSIELMSPGTYERPQGGWKVERVKSDKWVSGENVEMSDAPELGLPDIFPNWYSQFRFNNPGVLWSAIALVNGLPVVMERSYGKGVIVLTSDSYFASNEALWSGVDTSFLWWLVGGRRRVVFDETIHGNVEHGGIMKLILRYRLHGFFAGLFIFLALLAWSSGSSLVPGSEEMERGLTVADGAVVGEDVSSGMVRLLRRSVRPGELLERCVEIWEKSDERRGGSVESLTSDQKKEVDRLLEIRRSKPKEMSISEGYEKMVHVLSRKR